MKRIISAVALAVVVLTATAFTPSTAPGRTACIEIIPITPSDSTHSLPANTSGDVYFFVKKLSGATATTVTMSETHTGNLSNVVFGGGPNPFVLSIINQSLDVNYLFDAGAQRLKGNTIQVVATGSGSCGADTLTYVIAIT